MDRMDQHRRLQDIARRVLQALGETISASDTEASIARRATAMMADLGVRETWYHDCPAFVLLGSRSCLSISGAAYVPAEEPAGQTNLVTVDLSPLHEGIWGDCARSFVVEGGRCVANPALAEFAQGVMAEQSLHQQMIAFARADTSFGELFSLRTGPSKSWAMRISTSSAT